MVKKIKILVIISMILLALLGLEMLCRLTYTNKVPKKEIKIKKIETHYFTSKPSSK